MDAAPFTGFSLTVESVSLASTFEAASKHTKPMLKSTVSPMRWLSMMQAYVLHCRETVQVLNEKETSDRSIINLSLYQTTEL